jgi:hypothetical protein
MLADNPAAFEDALWSLTSYVTEAGETVPAKTLVGEPQHSVQCRSGGGQCHLQPVLWGVFSDGRQTDHSARWLNLNGLPEGIYSQGK